ncbi:hypothetical protein [Streptomyces fodineus]|nr:hypothetical protein [Streptomyces fodineus]
MAWKAARAAAAGSGAEKAPDPARAAMPDTPAPYDQATPLPDAA